MSYLELSWGSNFHITVCWEIICSLFSLLFLLHSHRAQGSCASEVLKQEKEGYVCSSPSTPQKVPLPFGSLLTWSANATPLGSQNSSPHSCMASIYSSACLQHGAASDRRSWGQRYKHQAQCHLTTRNVHKGSIMILSLFLELASNSQRF
jgi:hypothetical protein